MKQTLTLITVARVSLRYSWRTVLLCSAVLLAPLAVLNAAEVPQKGSIAYVNPVLVLVDPQSGIKISYVVGLFFRRSKAGPQKVIQHIAYDAPSKSWMIQCKLVPGNPLLDIGKDSEVSHTAPWSGWRHFSCSITRAHLMAALKALREQQPETNSSLAPADFQLSSFHLNAELTYETAPAELSWSMRRALLVHVE